MAESFVSSSKVSAGNKGRPGKFSWRLGDGRLSRSEKLEIISLVAAIGVSECSAWLIPILERDSRDSTMERWRC
ncbi:hypothetical protein [Bradyrhizobium sp. BR13661]|uniref:hypothetical protein n=1 Tax=Bradyrhizobium sp. BR13661 TaxID=2940622 RepID=UPI00247554E7|nr:hypothetical protein [Bradyrhizobium sp. BR13661]